MLASLPDPLILRILALAGYRGLQVFLLLSRSFYTLVTQNEEWVYHALSLNRWGEEDIVEPGTDGFPARPHEKWKQLFRAKHLEERTWELQMQTVPLVSTVWGPMFFFDMRTSDIIPAPFRGRTTTFFRVNAQASLAWVVDQLIARWEQHDPTLHLTPSDITLHAGGKPLNRLRRLSFYCGPDRVAAHAVATKSTTRPPAVYIHLGIRHRMRISRLIVRNPLLFGGSVVLRRLHTTDTIAQVEEAIHTTSGYRRGSFRIHLDDRGEGDDPPGGSTTIEAARGPRPCPELTLSDYGIGEGSTGLFLMPLDKTEEAAEATAQPQPRSPFSKQIVGIELLLGRRSTATITAVPSTPGHCPLPGSPKPTSPSRGRGGDDPRGSVHQKTAIHHSQTGYIGSSDNPARTQKKQAVTTTTSIKVSNDSDVDAPPAASITPAVASDTEISLPDLDGPPATPLVIRCIASRVLGDRESAMMRLAHADG
ncbi:hypothetical protein PAPYR_4792 [Paratrimastix pyriformis]|uniref:F-box domain-containing protein n=1 Tax=Paratrimastix pyriformis TaxID=342808 RepID=A0ABQ8UNH3_9EUKA|nr:hypothetical protein PAPYR_4792 [Paratrimastix pyriformis]